MCCWTLGIRRFKWLKVLSFIGGVKWSSSISSELEEWLESGLLKKDESLLSMPKSGLGKILSRRSLIT